MLQSTGSQRVGHNWVTEQQKAQPSLTKILFHSIYYMGAERIESKRSINSVQFSGSVVSDSLRPHEPQHTTPPCPSPTPGVHPNSCLLSR